MAAESTMPAGDIEIREAELELRAAGRQLRELEYRRATGRELPPDEPPLCSFCGAGENNVQRMLPGYEVGGVRAHICVRCVKEFHELDLEDK
jgi:hypothetical protein